MDIQDKKNKISENDKNRLMHDSKIHLIIEQVKAYQLSIMKLSKTNSDLKDEINKLRNAQQSTNI